MRKIYEVLYDLALPNGQEKQEGRTVTKSKSVEGGRGFTVSMEEAEAAPLVRMGVLGEPGALEAAREVERRNEERREEARRAETEAERIEQELRRQEQS